MPRTLEIILATIGLLLLSPVLIVLALIIKLDDGGPVFYRARRIGRDGHEFALLKFRSMIAGADKRGDGLTTMNDSRVTPMGSFLRRRKLDELPQLFNVLVGDMSFVGPRPEDPRYVEIYTAEQRRVLSTRPGITSPASIKFRNEETLLGGDNWEKKYMDEILPKKLAIELAYLPERTTWSDIRIIVRTLGVMGR
jgi:lipopolysaccharide/colanic/teichoic acid biosynthesis glycosyltransferase